MAKCCSDLNKHSEVEHLLIGSACTLFNSKVIENITNEHGNVAGYALQLLGNVYRKSDQLSKAAECYKASLKSNQFLWTSFESLCQMGEKVDAQDYFKTSTSGINTVMDYFLTQFESRAIHQRKHKLFCQTQRRTVNVTLCLLKILIHLMT